MSARVMPYNLFEQYDYITYLIGSMEVTAEKDDGSSKRENIESELLQRKVYPINPCKLEAIKTGLETDEIKEKLAGWVASGNWELFDEKAKEIWAGKIMLDDDLGLIIIPGDIMYCCISNWITFVYNKGDKPCGSFAETGIAMQQKIPAYILTDMPKKDLPKSLIQMIVVSNGNIFNSQKDYLEFLDKKYNLKKD